MDEATKELHDKLPKELQDVFFWSKEKDKIKEDTRQEAMQKTLEKIKAINKSSK